MVTPIDSERAVSHTGVLDDFQPPKLQPRLVDASHAGRSDYSERSRQLFVM